MTQKQAIQLFEERKVRTVWDDQTEEWYFSIVDVVGVLADGGRIDPDPVFQFFAPNEGCLVARIEPQGTEYPFPFCDTYTSVPNLSHNLAILIIFVITIVMTMQI
jgi:hypothetical protein